MNGELQIYPYILKGPSIILLYGLGDNFILASNALIVIYLGIYLVFYFNNNTSKDSFIYLNQESTLVQTNDFSIDVSLIDILLNTF